MKTDLTANGIKVMSSVTPEIRQDYNSWMKYIYRSLHDMSYGTKRSELKKQLTKKLNFTYSN